MDTPLIVEQDGKKVFVGKEDPNNPPVRPMEGSKMECPVCHKMVDYLVGENIHGGIQGCEMCWKPPQKQERREHEVTTKVVFD